MKHALISKSVCGMIEPAIRHVADRLYILTSARAGSQKRKPSIEKFFETGLVVAIYEYLLMLPELAHLEICHEKPYSKKTRPEQVDIWIMSPKGGRHTIIEAGDFSPKKVKEDATKMRRLNPSGTNWFLAFFRDQPTADRPNATSMDPWSKIEACRKRKGSLRGCHLEFDQRMTKSFRIDLPSQTVYFGFSLIRVNP